MFLHELLPVYRDLAKEWVLQLTPALILLTSFFREGVMTLFSTS